MLQGKSFFYIEDDKQNREIIKISLEAAGAKVEFEPWGLPDVAVNRLKRLKPDMILLDLMFSSGISGYEIYESIRQEESLAAIPVVAISASDAEIQIPKAKKLGFAGFISKPIDVTVFPSQLVTILNGQSIWI